MTTFIKSKKGKIFSIILIIVILAVAILATCLILREQEISKDTTYITALCKNRVMHAQYLPNVNKMATNGSFATEVVPTSYNKSTYGVGIENMNKDITVNAFNEVIDKIGELDNPYDREFTVLDIREEVYSVLSNCGVFDKWVSLKDTELAGTGSYYVSFNQETQRISIIRKSSFQPWVYDSTIKKIVDNDDLNLSTPEKPNYPIRSDDIYKIDYYYDSEGREVVECEILEVLNYYEETRVLQYQYVKNVKDTSFTKYVITPMTRLRVSSDSGDWGYDIDSQNPLGTYREFIQMDYTNKDDVSLMFITQRLASKYNDIKNTSQIKFYRKLGNELSLYNSAFTHADESYSLSSISSYYYDFFKYYTEDFDTMTYIGVPDEGYLQRSSKEVERVERELFYTNGIDSILMLPNSYYEKQLDDSDLAYFKTQNVALHVNQSLTSLAKNTNMSNENIEKILLDSPLYIDVSDTSKKYLYENFLDKYLNEITQNIVNTSYLKNNYNVIKNAVSESISSQNISGISDYIKLTDFTRSSTISDNTINFSASANIGKTILLKNNGSYSLGLIAQGSANNHIILATSDSVKYSNQDFTISFSGTYNFSNLKIKQDDIYTIAIALIYNTGDENILCSDAKYLKFEEEEPVFLSNAQFEGYKTTYDFSYNDGILKIKATVLDAEKPSIEINKDINDNTITVTADSKLKDLLHLFKFTDNDDVSYISFQRGGIDIYDYNEIITEGDYTVTVYDISGNSSSFNFTVILN